VKFRSVLAQLFPDLHRESVNHRIFNTMLGAALLLSSSTAAGEFSCVAKGAVCAPSDPPFCCPGLGCYNGGGFGYGEGGGEEVEEEERERRRKKEIEQDRGDSNPGWYGW
jgi:hypothetical protein